MAWRWYSGPRYGQRHQGENAKSYLNGFSAFMKVRFLTFCPNMILNTSENLLRAIIHQSARGGWKLRVYIARLLPVALREANPLRKYPWLRQDIQMRLSGRMRDLFRDSRSLRR